jgi:hypothetical protein
VGPEPKAPALPGNGPSWFTNATTSSSADSNVAQQGGTTTSKGGGGIGRAQDGGKAAVSLSKMSEQEVREAITLLDSDQVSEEGVRV